MSQKLVAELGNQTAADINIQLAKWIHLNEDLADLIAGNIGGGTQPNPYCFGDSRNAIDSEKNPGRVSIGIPVASDPTTCSLLIQGLDCPGR